ncbi:MAG: tetratricopeptide repeat protein [Microcystis aeruginosa LG13-03]|nr:tetratricopeptide repeat protein [Microcystis aeruginosa LG13-03]
MKLGTTEGLRNNRGIALYNLGRFGEAIASCVRALEIKPDLHQA